jgi:hypothetical protein
MILNHLFTEILGVQYVPRNCPNGIIVAQNLFHFLQNNLFQFDPTIIFILCKHWVSLLPNNGHHCCPTVTSIVPNSGSHCYHKHTDTAVNDIT